MAYLSVILPTYNSVKTVKRAVDSICAQSFRDWELLCIDDASNDGTPEYIEELSLNDSRIRVIRKPVNSGPAMSRNIGLDLAQGVWIGLIDSDDEWKHDRVDALLKHSNAADFIADNLLSYDATARQVTGQFFEPFDGDRLTLEDHLIHWHGQRQLDSGYLKPLMRSEFIKKYHLRYDQSLRHGEDFHLYSTALCEGAKFVLVNFYGYHYTTPLGALSGKGSPYSQTKSNELLIAARIQDLQQRYFLGLSEHDRRAFQYAVKYYTGRGMMRAFRAAVSRRNLPEIVKLLIMEPTLRIQLSAAIYRRIGAVKEIRPRLT